MRLQWQMHKLVWNLSGGRLGTRVMGMPVLELVTVGHRSGQERSILITYLPGDSGPVIAGTNAGAPHDPAWAKNLRAEPRARVREGGAWRHVRARFLEGEEHDRMWQQFVDSSDAYAAYRNMVDRPIPLVALDDAA